MLNLKTWSDTGSVTLNTRDPETWFYL